MKELTLLLVLLRTEGTDRLSIHGRPAEDYLAWVSKTWLKFLFWLVNHIFPSTNCPINYTVIPNPDPLNL